MAVAGPTPLNLVDSLPDAVLMLIPAPLLGCADGAVGEPLLSYFSLPLSFGFAFSPTVQSEVFASVAEPIL